MPTQNPQIGLMKEVCLFKSNTITATDSNGSIDGFGTLLTCYGQLIQKSGNVLNDYGEVSFHTSYTLYCRHSNLLEANLTTPENLIVVINNKTFKIQEYQKQDQKNAYYIINLATKF